MSNQTTVVDPWDSAENAKEPVYSAVTWGQVEATTYYCTLQKGYGKMPFDPAQHSSDQRRTAIDLLIHPLAEMNLQFDVTRSMIAESREWSGIILPSLRDLNVAARELNGKYVKVERVVLTDRLGNPETYVDKNGNVKEQTTLKFLAVWNTYAECLADYQATQGTAPAQTPTAPPVMNGHTNGNGAAANGDKERATALKFLDVFVKQACDGQTDINAVTEILAGRIANQPPVSRFFTVDSPETIGLIVKHIGG